MLLSCLFLFSSPCCDLFLFSNVQKGKGEAPFGSRSSLDSIGYNNDDLMRLDLDLAVSRHFLIRFLNSDLGVSGENKKKTKSNIILTPREHNHFVKKN